jgi:hypothetical protein
MVVPINMRRSKIKNLNKFLDLSSDLILNKLGIIFYLP